MAFRNHYAVLQAGLIPFALGGLGYFYRSARVFEFSRTKLGLLGLLFLANFVSGYWSDFHKHVSGLYIAAALNVALVPMLFTQTTKSHWQKVLGGLSYPIFLCHWFVATLIAIYVPAIGGKSFMLFAAATAGSLLFSLLLYFGIDRPVQAVRASVKKQGLVPGQRQLEAASGVQTTAANNPAYARNDNALLPAQILLRGWSERQTRQGVYYRSKADMTKRNCDVRSSRESGHAGAFMSPRPGQSSIHSSTAPLAKRIGR